MEERCVICGESIPEGRQVCPLCEKKYGGKDDSDMPSFFLPQKPKHHEQPAPIHKEGRG